MERDLFRPIPGATDPATLDLAEIDAAIELVVRTAATRVRLVSLDDPGSVAGLGLAHAQAAGVAFALKREASGVSLMIGPLMPQAMPTR